MRAAVWLLWLAAWGWPAALGCGPGRGAGRRRDPRKLTPLVFSQHEPNVYEQHDSAAGKAEGRIARNDSRFQDLQPNYNPDILFRDEEGTGADRFMTQRCKEKLNTLAISVMNQWPGIRLRVTEGWEEERHMQRESVLHYEGRAVDVTTSDRDKSKYGMLARLAVEAGFDWVYYETRAHIHCSVKSESSQAARSGGCFPASSVVRLEDGKTLSLAEVRPGHRVLAEDSSGKLVYSEVLTFLDRDENANRLFMRVTMENNATVTATEAHLLLLASGQATFAGSVKIGDELMVPGPRGTTAARRVISVDRVILKGVYAPLTRAGTLVVDGAVVSCYAAVDSDRLAHAALMPLRAWLGVASLMRSRPSLTVGVHPYVKTLYSIGRYLLPSDMFYD